MLPRDVVATLVSGGVRTREVKASKTFWFIHANLVDELKKQGGVGSPRLTVWVDRDNNPQLVVNMDEGNAFFQVQRQIKYHPLEVVDGQLSIKE